MDINDPDFNLMTRTSTEAATSTAAWFNSTYSYHSDHDGSNYWPMERDEFTQAASVDEEERYVHPGESRDLWDIIKSSLNFQELNQVLESLDLLMEEASPNLRAEMMEQIPQVANYLVQDCQMPTAMSDYLLPIVLKSLMDPYIEVRKISQATLIVMLMKNLISQEDIEDQICQVLFEMSHPDCSDENRCESVCIMARMAQQIEEEIAQRSILPRFEQLCKDEFSQMRKACAENIGDICNAIGSSKTEEILLPIFIKLSRDEIWGVRKACADNIMAVSFAVSLHLRHSVLAAIAIDLLQDKSKWVRMGAYKSLGQFIFSFVDSEDNTITNNNSDTTDLARKILPDLDLQNHQFIGGIATIDPIDTGSITGALAGQLPFPWQDGNNQFTTRTLGNFTHKSVDDIVNQLASMTVDNNGDINNLPYPVKKNRSRASSLNSSISASPILFSTKSVNNGDQAIEQDLIPQTLLDNYLAMVNPEVIEKVDVQLPYFCAYNLPAVTLALGRRYWHYLKRVYASLAINPQVKVRRTLAHSFIDMALILGMDITTKDLVPVFHEFMQDSKEEVRMGILKHLHQFIQLLPYQIQIQYLPLLKEFIPSYSSSNWRMRFDYIQQLILLSEIYPPAELYTFFCPVALNLAADSVASVRKKANVLICDLMKRFREFSDLTLWDSFCQEIVTIFSNHPHWLRRQEYTHLCQSLLENQSETPEDFAVRFLPSLLELATDKVPNVRLGVARTLSQTISKIGKAFFHDITLCLLHNFNPIV
ncbi:uncharacterized protein TRIADDRAFT_55822 [Trichoplax adhaerens]|uniref:Phosphatase 2A Regulatory Subunit A helical domain-containing protein n=1 Tax=Trichoplax adhaerens TaxID=10228 RepID=B3RVY6_TRIAD|nr:hypothetical protein TRIADDRAFT_55822 [Trichoplax adhaerens]EDV25579.1 hypothetical protein TRIADDRAFT_55822 [Trichoplax adhaerens]|eukprot:XP_002111612.1 hypothetical protein TRIADDRAFT_55822 [Trichoplax adhaerens]